MDQEMAYSTYTTEAIVLARALLLRLERRRLCGVATLDLANTTGKGYYGRASGTL